MHARHSAQEAGRRAGAQSAERSFAVAITEWRKADWMSEIEHRECGLIKPGPEQAPAASSGQSRITTKPSEQPSPPGGAARRGNGDQQGGVRQGGPPQRAARTQPGEEHGAAESPPGLPGEWPTRQPSYAQRLFEKGAAPGAPRRRLSRRRAAGRNAHRSRISLCTLATGKQRRGGGGGIDAPARRRQLTRRAAPVAPATANVKLQTAGADGLDSQELPPVAGSSLHLVM